MVDYELRDLENLLCESDEEDLEGVYLLLVMQRQQELAEAAARRSLFVFDYQNIPELDFKTKLRFHKNDILDLVAALWMPWEFIAPNGPRWSGVEGLCVVLWRLSSGGNMSDFEDVFGRNETSLSILLNVMLTFLYNQWSPLFTDLKRHIGHGRWLSRNQLDMAAASVVQVGGPLNKTRGFIDWTGRAICRPTIHQRMWYSEHKGRHMQKFQGVSTPFVFSTTLFLSLPEFVLR